MTKLPLLLLSVAGLLASGCSQVGCNAPLGYRATQLEQPLRTPEGLAAPASRNDYELQPGPVATDPEASACFVRPPQVVEAPAKG
jgi:uncharacterized lipoprotein